MRTTTIALTLLLIGCGTKETPSEAETADAATPETTSGDDGAPVPTGTDTETAATETASSPDPTTRPADRPAIACEPVLADCTASVEVLDGIDGTPLATERLWYSACGLPLEHLTTFEAYGDVEEYQVVFTYDDDDYLVRERREGIFGDIELAYTYDAWGRLDVLSEYDLWGELDADTLHTYDAQGRLTYRERTSYWGDDTLVVADRFVPSGDEAEGGTEIDENDDGTIDEVESWVRTDTLHESWSTDTFFSSTSYRRDTFEDGRLMASERDGDDDGVWDSIEAWSYDGAGRITEVRADIGADDIDDIVWQYAWTCP